MARPSDPRPERPRGARVPRGDQPEDRPLADDDQDWAVPTEDRLRVARPPQTVGDLLEGLVDQRGWAGRLRSTEVFNRWTELVGPELARRCEPVRLAGGVLVVRTETQAWAAQVRYLSGTLRRRAREVLGQPVDKVDIVIGPLEGTVSTSD